MIDRQPPFRFATQEPRPRRTINVVPWLLLGAVVAIALLVARTHGWPL